MNAHVAKPVDMNILVPTMMKCLKNKTIWRYTSDRELNRNKGADIMKAWERLINYVTVRTPSDEESETVPSSVCQFDWRGSWKKK